MNATYNLLGKDYVLDVGMNRLEVDKEGNNDFWYSSRIIDQGDLSTYYGYETLDASGFAIRQGGIYPNNLINFGDLKDIDPFDLLKQGYTYVRVANIPVGMLESPIPMNIIGSTYELPELQLEVGINPTFILEKDGKPHYAVINGFLIDLISGKSDFKNAMIYR